jgi:hypothetical protein
MFSDHLDTLFDSILRLSLWIITAGKCLWTDSRMCLVPEGLRACLWQRGLLGLPWVLMWEVLWQRK